MRVDVVTLFPDELRRSVEYGVTGRAIEAGLVELYCWNPRDYAGDKRGTVDDRPFGGGPGMVMMVEPLTRCLDAVEADAGPAPVIHLSPQGRRLDQALVARLAHRDRIVLLCGRYEGIDERLIETRVDEEISIGDYVLSGGELAAGVIIDAVTRLQPGALGKQASAAQDSFTTGLLDCPHYTRPEKLGELGVPAVLMSGDHGNVDRWRLKQSLGRTWLRRPELLAERTLSAPERALLEEFIADYVAEHNGSAVKKER